MKNFDSGYFCVELIFQSMNLNERSFDIKLIEIIHKLKDFFSNRGRFLGASAIFLFAFCVQVLSNPQGQWLL